MAHISLKSVSIRFPIYGVGKRTFKKELIRIATGGLLTKDKNNVITVNALNNISLEIPNGMRLGLIGHNGAGKSTLLRVLAGIYEPTEGEMTTQGKITTMFDLMVGIQEESTGFENIMISGLLQGLTRRETVQNFDAIAQFSELGDYLRMPIRTYSSGMKVRLAFGIATHIAPEILIIDEVFGAGDASFAEKAIAKMHGMIQSSKIVVFTSHSLDIVRDICTHVLWLDAGTSKFFGPAEEGINMYLESVRNCKS